METIRTAEMSGGLSADATAPESLVRNAWPHDRAPFQMPQGTSRTEHTEAEVNHGRWVVKCPFCPGAQLASEGDPRFFCVDCLHAGTRAEGKWLDVEWPEQRADIEQALCIRPASATMNWRPGETVQDLIAENGELLEWA